jgi:hypothetical protein
VHHDNNLLNPRVATTLFNVWNISASNKVTVVARLLPWRASMLEFCEAEEAGRAATLRVAATTALVICLRDVATFFSASALTSWADVAEIPAVVASWWWLLARCMECVCVYVRNGESGVCGEKRWMLTNGASVLLNGCKEISDDCVRIVDCSALLDLDCGRGDCYVMVSAPYGGTGLLYLPPMNKLKKAKLAMKEVFIVGNFCKLSFERVSVVDVEFEDGCS